MDSLILRPVTLDDAENLLEWRNDFQTRRASHNTQVIDKKEHISWLKHTLANQDRRLMIAEEDGTPVGVVRADLSDGVYELSWTIAPSARSKGIGKRMVAQMASRIHDPIRAEVKSGNTASIKIAQSAGMSFSHEDGGTIHFTRPAINT